MSANRLNTANPIRNRSGGGPVLRPNAGLESGTLRRWKTAESIQHGHAQLLQSRVCQLHLGLDTGGTDQSAVRGALGHVLHQCRLAHSWVAVDHQHPTPARPQIPQHTIQLAAFGPAVDQLHRHR